MCNWWSARRAAWRNMPRADVIALALRELAEFFPAVSDAKLEKAHVVKEIRATFSAAPGPRIAPAGRAATPIPQSVPGRRLDPLRLARHHGRRGAQRLPGGGSRRGKKVSASRYRIIGDHEEVSRNGLSGSSTRARGRFHQTRDPRHHRIRAAPSKTPAWWSNSAAAAKVKPNPKFRKEWDVKTSQEGLVKLPSIQKGPI